jgi:hypothetical protein
MGPLRRTLQYTKGEPSLMSSKLEDTSIRAVHVPVVPGHTMDVGVKIPVHCVEDRVPVVLLFDFR